MKVIKAQSKDKQVEHGKVLLLRTYKARQCNLCQEEFRPRSKFDRFCENCRHESELYHFAEWLSA